jgi:Na+/glutamate symporter
MLFSLCQNVSHLHLILCSQFYNCLILGLHLKQDINFYQSLYYDFYVSGSLVGLILLGSMLLELCVCGVCFPASSSLTHVSLLIFFVWMTYLLLLRME